jgi:hypothetical protein
MRQVCPLIYKETISLKFGSLKKLSTLISLSIINAQKHIKNIDLNTGLY